MTSCSCLCVCLGGLGLFPWWGNRVKWFGCFDLVNFGVLCCESGNFWMLSCTRVTGSFVSCILGLFFGCMLDVGLASMLFCIDCVQGTMETFQRQFGLVKGFEFVPPSRFYNSDSGVQLSHPWVESRLSHMGLAVGSSQIQNPWNYLKFENYI